MKKTYLIVSIAIFLLTFSKVESQNLTNYNLYVMNPVLYNPAYAIDDSKIRAFANTHMQWIGFDGAPRANTFGLYSSNIKNMGFGLSVFNNKQGITNFSNLDLTYAYRVNFNEAHYLTFGVSAGFMMERIQNSEITNADVTDPTIVNNTFKQNSFAARTGLVYFNKGFEASLAIPQLIRSGKSSGYVVSILSYNFKLDDSWNLKPIIMYRDVKTSPAQFDGSIMASWKNTIWAQFGYRSNQSYLMCFGVNWKDLKFGYAYQLEAGDISSVGTSHEIQLAYSFEKGPNVVKYEKVKPIAPSTNVSIIHDTVYVKLLSENTKVMGTIVRKSDNKPIAGTITVTENNTEVQKTETDNGVFNVDLKSGKTYKFEASSENYPAVSQTIEIPKETLIKEVKLVVDYTPAIKVIVTDPETKAPLNTKIIISTNGKVHQTINTETNSSVKLQPGVYLFDCSSEGYYNKKVTVDLSQEAVNQNIQLDKVKKESFTLGQINFQTAKAILLPESLPILDNFVTVLNNNPTLKFEISGHTDNAGHAQANKKLSQQRAQACVNYMVSKGIDANRLKPVGYGQSKPLVPNDTKENRFKNRRVEAKIIE